MIVDTKKIMIAIIVCTCIVGIGLILKSLNMGFGQYIFNFGIALEIIVGAYAMYTLIKNK